MKTLVTAAHHGEAPNGTGGCFARWHNGGRCPGEQTAAWLNGLGEDEAPHGRLQRITNGQVRANWLAGYNHIQVADTVIRDANLRVVQARTALRKALRELRSRKLVAARVGATE